MREYHYELDAEFGQFYLENEGDEINTANIWTPEAMQNLIAFDPDSRRGFGVGTIQNITADVTVQIRDSAPGDESFDAWDQVNEISIDLPSGTLILAGCVEWRPDAIHLPVEAGPYRARVYYGGLDTENDHYRIVLWPAPSGALRILKRRREE